MMLQILLSVDPVAEISPAFGAAHEYSLPLTVAVTAFSPNRQLYCSPL
eukprot:UN03009